MAKAKVEASTITALIGFAVIIGGIVIGAITYPSQNGIGIGIIIVSIVFGSFLIITRLAPSMFKKR